MIKHWLNVWLLCQDSGLDAVIVMTSVGRTYRCKRVIVAAPPQQARMFSCSHLGLAAVFQMLLFYIRPS